MPRFAVLQHDSPEGLHWDFFLEAGDVLRTWALPQPPTAGAEMPARQLPDHRLAYLDYEGPIAGQRGNVVRWDQGTYQVFRKEDVELAIDLAGQRLTGRVTLRRSASEPEQWQFLFVASDHGPVTPST